MKRICVFCGSRSGIHPEYTDGAKAMGRTLVQHGIDLVYGGASVGLMGALADEVLSGGGQVIGVIPGHLASREVAHENLTELHVVSSMHERKAKMAELADGFIAMPGGFGTFEEFCEIVTWAQLGLHRKPTGLLNVRSFYDPLLALINLGNRDGFITDAHRSLVMWSASAGDLIDQMQLLNGESAAQGAKLR